MNALARMDRSVDTVVHDLEIVLERMHRLEKDLRITDSSRHHHSVRLNETLADLQARIEGIEVFVRACQRRAHRQELPPDTIDL